MGAGEAGQQIGILNKRFAEILAVSKDGDGVIHQERPPVKQLKQLARSLLCGAFKQIQRGIGVGRISQQIGQQPGCGGRNARAYAIQIETGALAVLKSDFHKLEA